MHAGQSALPIPHRRLRTVLVHSSSSSTEAGCRSRRSPAVRSRGDRHPHLLPHLRTVVRPRRRGRRRRLVKLRPDRDHPVTKGFSCHKGLAAVDVHHDPDRLDRPMLRAADGSWSEASWDEAMAEPRRGGCRRSPPSTGAMRSPRTSATRRRSTRSARCTSRRCCAASACGARSRRARRTAPTSSSPARPCSARRPCTRSPTSSTPTCASSSARTRVRRRPASTPHPERARRDASGHGTRRSVRVRQPAPDRDAGPRRRRHRRSSVPTPTCGSSPRCCTRSIALGGFDREVCSHGTAATSTACVRSSPSTRPSASPTSPACRPTWSASWRRVGGDAARVGARIDRHQHGTPGHARLLAGAHAVVRHRSARRRGRQPEERRLLPERPVGRRRARAGLRRHRVRHACDAARCPAR